MAKIVDLNEERKPQSRAHGDRFTQEKFRWLEQIAKDPALSAAALRVAIIIVTKYINRKTGTARPSAETLAHDTKSCVRTAISATHALVKNGHLEGYLGGGRHRTNEYWLVLKTVHGTAPFNAGKPCSRLQGLDASEAAEIAVKPCNPTSRNPAI
jgi:hypothetical protein